VGGGRRRADVDDVQHRVRGRLDPHHARVLIEVLAQVRKVGGRHVVEEVALRLVDLRGHPVDAAVDVRDEDDALAGIDEMHQRRRGAEPGRERDAVVGALERRERRCERRARRVRDARVVVALVLADRVLDEGRRLVDRRDDRARRGIGLLALVYRARLELHRAKSTSGRPARRQHAGEPRERRVEAVVEIAAHAGLRVERLHAQNALASVVLEIDAADEPVASQERQHVVAVDALVLALVHLDHVTEAEDPLEVGPVPQEVVERGEEHSGWAASLRLLVGGHEHRSLAVGDLEPPQQAFPHEHIRVRADSAAPPRSRNISATAASVRAPRARTQRSAAQRTYSSRVGTGRSRSSAGTTRSGRS
jgi:hypothetical protein